MMNQVKTLTQEVQELKGEKGSEDTLRKGREYFERVGEDGRDPISPVSLAVEQKVDPGDCLGSYRGVDETGET